MVLLFFVVGRIGGWMYGCDWMHGWLSVCVDGCVEPLAWLNLPQARFVCSTVVLLFFLLLDG